MKRTLTALAAALLPAASGVHAQTPAAPARPEASPFSPLAYDALGATPKIQLGKAQKVETARSNAAANPRTPAPHAAAPAAGTTH